MDYTTTDPLHEPTEKLGDFTANIVTMFGKFRGGTSAGLVTRYPVYEAIKRERAFKVTENNFYDRDTGEKVNSFRTSVRLKKFRDVHLTGSRRVDSNLRVLPWVPSKQEIKDKRWTQSRSIFNDIYH